jgi:hypothetical protein
MSSPWPWLKLLNWSLAHGISRAMQRLLNISALEVRISCQDILVRHPASNHADPPW